MLHVLWHRGVIFHMRPLSNRPAGYWLVESQISPTGTVLSQRPHFGLLVIKCRPIVYVYEYSFPKSYALPGPSSRPHKPQWKIVLYPWQLENTPLLTFSSLLVLIFLGKPQQERGDKSGQDQVPRRRLRQEIPVLSEALEETLFCKNAGKQGQGHWIEMKRNFRKSPQKEREGSCRRGDPYRTQAYVGRQDCVICNM